MPLLPPSKTSQKISPGSVVEYELHGSPMLAIASQAKGTKWQIINAEGQALEMQPARLFLYPEVFKGELRSEGIAEFLGRFLAGADELRELFDEEAVWKNLKDGAREYTVEEISTAGFEDTSAQCLLATRRILLEGSAYFKRKNTTFSPRTENAVQEMKTQLEVMRSRQLALQELSSWLESPNGEPPEIISELEKIAVKDPHLKEVSGYIESLPGKEPIDKKAFKLLVSSGVWKKDIDLNLVKANLHKGFPVDVKTEAKSAAKRSRDVPYFDALCLTIDGEATTDLDDAISFVENSDGAEIGVHIADASLFVQPETILDREAAKRGTSIYCPDYKISMLPGEISSGAASLIEGEERSVISFIVALDKEGNVISRDIKLSRIKVACRLSYNEADQILYGELEHEHAELLTALWKYTSLLQTKRLIAGADSFLRTNKYPALDSDGRISLKSPEETASSSLVTEAMVLANETAAEFAAKRSLPLLFRVQEAPDVNPDEAAAEVPEGPAREFKKRSFLKRSVVTAKAGPHYGLGVKFYAQVTSPIRRYVDLLNHRQILSVVQDYKDIQLNEDELLECFKNLEPKLDTARSVQRDREQYWIGQYLKQENIKQLQAVVVRVDGPRPLAFLELLGFACPFKNKRKSKPELGENLVLEITRVNPLELALF